MADKETIQTYNLMANEYDEETADFWDKFPYQIFQKFSDILPLNSTVLDIGSGPGRDGLILKKKGLRTICLDASVAMTSLTTTKGLPSVLADLLYIPFSDDTFDGAWAYTSLLHITKAEIPQALRETHRVMKQGGVFGLGLIEGDNEGPITSSAMSRPRHFSFYRSHEVTQLLKEAGFDIFHFELFRPKSRNYLNFLAQKI